MFEFLFPSSEPVLYQQLIDVTFALMMYLVLARLFIHIFITEDNKSSPLKWLGSVTTPVLICLRPLTPKALNKRASEAYAAIILFLCRYYILPTLLGYDVRKLGDLPFETLISELLRVGM